MSVTHHIVMELIPASLRSSFFSFLTSFFCPLSWLLVSRGGVGEFRCGFGAVLGGCTGGARSDFSIPHCETMRVSCVDGGWRGFGDDALRGDVMSELAWAGVTSGCRNGKIVENSRETAFEDVFRIAQ